MNSFRFLLIGFLIAFVGACGDVERNVMACPAPHHHDGVRAQLQATAAALAAQLAPRTRGYHEIWLNGKAVELNGAPAKSATEEQEPLYGKSYLPRKFKTGLALPEDNCIDVYAQDLGLLAIVANQESILGNQAKLDKVLANQATIVANQESIQDNQAEILRNQRTILANQEKILKK